MAADDRLSPLEDEPSEAVLTFREQADGRKVGRLPGGKVVLVAFAEMERVRDGERWRVRLKHRDTFSIAEPIEREKPIATNPAFADSPVLASLRARVATPAAPEAPAAPTPPVFPPPAAVAVPAPPPAPAAPVSAQPAATAPAAPATAPPARPAVRPPAGARPPLVTGDQLDVRPSPIHPSRVVGMNDRVAMFIDGANMDLACRLAGYFLDYRRARQFFLAHGLFYAAYYYIADYTASDPLQQRYLDFLAHADFIVRRKAVKAIRDQETGERVLKANVDTELVLDLINTADNYDLAFLFSGDSDFERAVDLLRSRGKRVYIVTARPVLSRELSYVADKPIFFIEDFVEMLKRDKPALGEANP